jgi:DNA-binding PadR family transcriptional regulator
LSIPLTPTSFIVLGLLDLAGPSTPYALKQGVAGTVGNFWSVPHSQLYAEPERLAKAGYVTEERESGGRRRRTYTITAAGREALAGWLAEAELPAPEMRDPGLLKLFFGADPAAIAPREAERHRSRLEEYRAMRAAIEGQPGTEGPVLTLDAGIAHGELWVAYWERLATREPSSRAE